MLHESMLECVLYNESVHIFFITDQYWDLSMKSCERNRCALSGSIRVTASRRDQKIPKQIKKYLSVGANKKELIEFLLNDWSTDNRHIKSLSNRCIYFSTNDAGYKLYIHQDEVVCQTMDQLCSNQEEADTKVFLTAKIADVGCTSFNGTDWYW